MGLFASRAEAVITALYPLKDVLATGQYIFMAKINKIDPDKPALVLGVEEKLKGQPPFDKLAVNLTGDSEGQKAKHTPQLLKRLEADLPVVVFVNQRGKRYEAFVYSNGTWFQTIGQTDKDDAAKIRWAFTHCEPYLRRTFKGTTADLRQVIIDGLSGKKAPPEPDPKVPPGLGPELERRGGEGEKGRGGDEKKEAEARGSEKRNGRLAFNPTCKRTQLASFLPFSPSLLLPLFLSPSPPPPLSLIAVIPTFVIMGPLALLATLFPAVFGGLAFFMRRWMVLLSVACLASTLYWLHHWFQLKIEDYWWGTSTALWITLAALSVLGVLWSYARHRSAVSGPEADKMQLKGGDIIALRILSLIGLAILFYCLGTGELWYPEWKRETLAIWIAIWAGTIYAMIVLYRLNRRARRADAPVRSEPTLAPEGFMLGVLALVFVGLGIVGQRQLDAVSQAAPGNLASIDPVPQLKGVIWKFDPKDQGNFSSSPLVVGDRIYQAAFHKANFSAFGALYCLDRKTGNVIWKFDDDGDMKAVFSTPCLADGRLYIGEGFHQDSNCKLYCIEAASGKKLWDCPTASHTESSPCVTNGRVIFGAGDDGVFCLDAKTSKRLWHFEGLHVDTNLTVSGHRVFGGSGYNGNAIFCLDVNTGEPLWRHAVDLPCFASPTRTAGEHVLFGLGNGDFISSDENPAGALLCVEVKTGELVWRFDVADAVHGKPAVDHRHVYFGSRDGFCYCLDKENGELVWKESLGSPIVASLVLARCPHCGNYTGLYAAASGGKVVCLGANSGQVNWTFDMSRDSQKQAQLLSTPAVIMEADENGSRNLIYLGSGLSGPLNSSAVLYCLQDELDAH
jgi:outer membrane protein assembly factor BamB